eukprot:TRINITY_DN923_c0_g1_i2.p1 TRINITY_DN923_c0_g1~~TRINITY_DN923_c0_g1_i2.p1  ORF type:complete len:101 (-),score=0.96 TRINITY_DN923_c0_g1_i2:775-1077(-)
MGKSYDERVEDMVFSICESLVKVDAQPTQTSKVLTQSCRRDPKTRSCTCAASWPRLPGGTQRERRSVLVPARNDDAPQYHDKVTQWPGKVTQCPDKAAVP